MITEEKSCAARIERLVGTFSFTLDGWNELPDKVGESTESPEFELCGKLWQLRIFPGGSLENHVGFISYYLASKSSTVTRAAYKLIIKNQKQGGADEVFASSGIRKFEAKGVQVDGWGRDKFVSASQLKDPWLGFCVNDTVIFQVEIAVYGGLTPISPAVNLAGQSVLSLSQSIMRSMFDNKDSFSDVVIDVTGERIYAHKCILSARSPVFHCMLHGGMTESVTSIITINDIDADIIRELVSFIYSDIISNLQTLDSILLDLYVAACRFQVAGLVSVCEKRMMEIITPLSSIEMLRIADLMEATRLKGSILSYIAAHFGEVVHTDGYKLIVSESDCEIYGSLMNDIVTFVNQQATHKANCLGLVSSFIHVSGTVSHKHYETPQHPTPVPNQRVNSCTIM